MSSTWLVIGPAFVILGMAGQYYEFSTVLLAVCVTIMGIAIDFRSRRPRVLRLLDIWCFAFAYLFGSDALVTLSDVRDDFGIRLASSAEGVIVAAFGATLVGYALAQAIASHPRRHRHPIVRRLSAEILLLLVLSALILVYVMVVASPAELLARRSMRENRALGEASVAVVAAMIVQSALTARLMVLIRRRAILAFPVAVAALSVVVLYLIGTRYFLGFLAFSVLFYATRMMEPLSRRQLSFFAVAVVALALVQGTMRFVRGTGLGAADRSSVVSAAGRPETYLSSEGMLRVHAWVHLKRIFDEEGRSPEHAFMLYWWIPRTLWPSKPTMDGYWLAHEVMADGDVGAGHSVAGGFVLPALLDFGPLGGVSFCLLYGIVLWRLDRFLAAHRNPRDPASVFAALLPFAVFFGMRSPQTSAIFLESCVAVYLPIFLVLKISAPARRRRLAVSAARNISVASTAARTGSVPVAARWATARSRRWVRGAV